MLLLLFVLPFVFGNEDVCIQTTTPKLICKAINQLYMYETKLSVPGDFQLFHNETHSIYSCKPPAGYNGVHVIADFGHSEHGHVATNRTFDYFATDCTAYCHQESGFYGYKDATSGVFYTIFQVACYAYKNTGQASAYESFAELRDLYKLP